jgi:hypothetical protein
MLGAVPPLPQYVSMAWCLVKHRDNFTFLPLSVSYKYTGVLAIKQFREFHSLGLFKVKRGPCHHSMDRLLYVEQTASTYGK